MKRKLCAVCVGILFLLIGVSEVVWGQVQPAWMARYKGPGQGDDIPQAMALDGNGNLYVTGLSLGSYTSSDYATVKYNTATGTHLWAKRYNGPPNGLGFGIDNAYDIALDQDGNVYVTGISQAGFINYDYATVAYKPSGFEFMAEHYDGSIGEQANAIAVDNAGSVYVTGRSGNGNDDYVTVKYPAKGEPAWSAPAVYDHNGNDDIALAIAVDSNGDVFVTGSSEGQNGKDYATIKYDGATGQPLWSQAARYDGPDHLNDVATAMAVDANGDVFVTGWSEGDITESDCVTIKYNGVTGALAWSQVARYNGPDSLRDVAEAIAVDAGGMCSSQVGRREAQRAMILSQLSTRGIPMLRCGIPGMRDRPTARAMETILPMRLP